MIYLNLRFNSDPYLRFQQHSRVVLRKRCSENMQQIYRRILMPKCDLLQSHFGMGGFLKICCMFLEHLFTRTPMKGCLRHFTKQWYPSLLAVHVKILCPLDMPRKRWIANAKETLGNEDHLKNIRVLHWFYVLQEIIFMCSGTKRQLLFSPLVYFKEVNLSVTYIKTKGEV